MVWNLAANTVIDFFGEDEEARVLNVVDRHWQYLVPRWYKWAFYPSYVMRRAYFIIVV